jgi:hypothetical protein
MTDEPQTTGPMVSGKLFVVGFVATGALVLLLALNLRSSLHEHIQTAQLAALPTLAAPLEATCVGPDGMRAKLHRGGVCRAGHPLELVVHTTGNGTESVHAVLVASDAARSVTLEAGAPASLPLDTQGPRALGLLLANVALPAGALDAALAGAPGIDGRLAALDRYVAKLIDADFHARAEALRFTVVP